MNTTDPTAIGKQMFQFAHQLWPINRSLTGAGVRQTLHHIQQHIPELTLHEVPSGTPVFDWTVPQEWKVNSAYILTPEGEKICDVAQNNLHLVGYSTAVDKRLSLIELKQHLYTLPEQPDAIPYITSYYQKRWGFCLTHEQFNKLPEGEYRVVIDTELFDGHLSYGELILPGASSQEILLSTYICHPSMANNELSGPVVSTFIAKWLSSLSQRHYTYRIIFIPETIGSITYLARHKDYLKQQVVAGFNVSCVGDERAYSYLPSRHGNTLSDEIAKHVLHHTDPDYVRYHWSDRGSDERQYCAPGIDLPIATMMRSKYGCYPEYHTSLDKLGTVVTTNGLEGSFCMLHRALEAIEHNIYPVVTVFGEPQLGKRGLYPTLSTKESGEQVRTMMELISWSDGKHSLLQIAERCHVPIWELYATVATLQQHGLLQVHRDPLRL